MIVNTEKTMSKQELIDLLKKLKKQAKDAELAFDRARTTANGKLMVETSRALADKFGMFGDLRALSDSYGITV